MLAVRLISRLLVLSLSLAPRPPWSDLPTRTLTSGGVAGDPVNVAVEGSQVQILADFHAMGWLKADPLSLKDDARLAVDAVFHRLYPTAPVSNLFLFHRPEDFAVEHELGSVAQRDHARFWDTGRKDPGTGLELWIGDASQDVGIEILRRHHIPIGTTHRINPNVDAERARVVSGLQGADKVVTVIMEPGMGATTNGRNGGGDHFSTDGKVALIVLRR
ncbi:MAG TPA: LssY C-terminal domain-containing protein [Chloroflexota bacterium]|nr:LssY C-terminal domain-containing protein [Chloroflexota bacterium]